jgi:hypothetical protein
MLDAVHSVGILHVRLEVPWRGPVRPIMARLDVTSQDATGDMGIALSPHLPHEIPADDGVETESDRGPNQKAGKQHEPELPIFGRLPNLVNGPTGG